MIVFWQSEPNWSVYWFL